MKGKGNFGGGVRSDRDLSYDTLKTLTTAGEFGDREISSNWERQ